MKLDDEIMVDLTSHMNDKFSSAILDFMDRGKVVEADYPSMMAAVAIVTMKHAVMAMRVMSRDEEDFVTLARMVFKDEHKRKGNRDGK
jgi:hypothetical protein